MSAARVITEEKLTTIKTAETVGLRLRAMTRVTTEQSTFDPVTHDP